MNRTGLLILGAIWFLAGTFINVSYDISALTTAGLVLLGIGANTK